MRPILESEGLEVEIKRVLSSERESKRRFLAYDPTLKRLLDVVVASLTLVATLPIWLIIVIAIKAETSGPIIFAQNRIGKGGRPFRFYKFRSMHVDAEERLSHIRPLNEVSGPVFKIRSDPRVTRVGRMIRRTSLDELPQLVNVIRGEMSLVGPRPALPAEVAQYDPADRIRLAVKPGLTCFWQIRGRSSVGFAKWMEYDREYVRRRSFWVDLMILARTVGAVVSGHGAY